MNGTDWIGIVANPGSGSGPNRERVEGLAQRLWDHGHQARVIWDPVEEVEELGTGACRLIVACGGDGTINRVLNAPWRKPLAVLPLGTENLFARYFGFDGDIERLVAAIEEFQIRPVDVGVAGERRFSLMVTAGFDAEVIRRLDRWRTEKGSVKRVRHASYAAPIAATLWKYGYPEVTLKADGEQHTGPLVMVFNLPMYAFKLGLMPEAREDDGQLHWFVFERPGSLRLFGFVKDVFRGAHLNRPDVHHGRSTHIELSGDEAPIQLDGEAAGTTPVAVDIQPGALQMLRM